MSIGRRSANNSMLTVSSTGGKCQASTYTSARGPGAPSIGAAGGFLIRSGPLKASNAVYTAPAPNRFKDFWRERVTRNRSGVRLFDIRRRSIPPPPQGPAAQALALMLGLFSSCGLRSPSRPDTRSTAGPAPSVPTEASGCRSMVRRSIALVMPQPGQNTSSHGVPARSAARIVGDRSMSRPRAKGRNSKRHSAD